MKRLIPLFAATILLLSFYFPSPASAAEIPSLHVTSPTQALRDETWEVTLSVRGDPDQKLAAFRLLVHYDSSYLTLKRMVTHESIPSGDFRYSVKTDSATGIYASAKQGISWNGECVTLVFSVNEDAPPGSTKVTISMDQMVGENSNSIPGTQQSVQSVAIASLQNPQAALSRLLPSSGTLEPAFSPDQLDYSITVPYEVTSMTFDMDASDQGTARVNRKNLNKAGIPTVFLITATSADGNQKTQYTVTVYRQEKISTPGGTTSATSSHSQGIDASSPSKTSSSKTSSSKASSSKTSSIKSSSTKNSSSLSKTSGKETALDQTGTVENANPNIEATPVMYGDRYLYQNSNQMPAFVIGILCACICGLLCIILFLLWNRKKEEKNPDNSQENSPDEKNKIDPPSKSR
ncbi:MAG: hypothetical protein HFJ84_01235 [Clostridiales bacterium]|jgi:hypothetical protein|nr:hypothetical protein [Clostridiales bacterium]